MVIKGDTRSLDYSTYRALGFESIGKALRASLGGPPDMYKRSTPNGRP